MSVFRPRVSRCIIMVSERAAASSTNTPVVQRRRWRQWVLPVMVCLKMRDNVSHECVALLLGFTVYLGAGGEEEHIN